MTMQKGEHKWDTPNELRTRCELTMRLTDGYVFYTGGKRPLAVATLMPDGRTLDITLVVDRVLALITKERPNETACN